MFLDGYNTKSTPNHDRYIPMDMGGGGGGGGWRGRVGAGKDNHKKTTVFAIRQTMLVLLARLSNPQGRESLETVTRVLWWPHQLHGTYKILTSWGDE